MNININNHPWSPKKKRYVTYSILFALALIATAVFIVLDKLGLGPVFVGGIALWQICLGLFLLFLLIVTCIEKAFFLIPFLLGFIFLIFQKNIFMACGRVEAEATPFSFWLVMLIAALLGIGLAIIFGKHSTSGVHIHVGGDAIDDNDDDEDDDDDENVVINCENNYKDSVLYIDPAISTSPYNIENNMGTMNVYFENTEAFEGKYVLHIENNMSTLNIYVPENWSLDTAIGTNLGHTHTPRPNDTPKKANLLIKGENNLGHVNITYR